MRQLTRQKEERRVCGGLMVIRPESPGLSAARQRIRTVAVELGFAGERVVDLELAVGEAVSNAYVHGGLSSGTDLIHVSWHFADDALTVTIKDGGDGFAPEAVRREDTRGGYGLNVMRACVDEVDFHRDGGTKVVLRKQRGRDILSAWPPKLLTED